MNTQPPANPTQPFDRDTAVHFLNEVLATEIVFVLRYQSHGAAAAALQAHAVAEEFLELANQEQRHADLVAERITQLGGEPNLHPGDSVPSSPSPSPEGKSPSDLLREDLAAERIAIESYREIIGCLRDDDPESSAILETILAQEEQHADHLKTRLETLGKEEPAAAPAPSPSSGPIDPVEEASEESFPASDPPSWTTGREVGSGKSRR